MIPKQGIKERKEFDRTRFVTEDGYSWTDRERGVLASAWSSDREKTIFTEHQCGEIVRDRFESRRVVKALKDVLRQTTRRGRKLCSLYCASEN